MEFTKKFPRLYFFVLSYFFLIVHVNPISFERRSTYIVYMDKSVMPKVFTHHHNWYSSIIDFFKVLNMLSLDDDHQSFPSILYTYEHAFNGFCAVLSVHELKVLKRYPGFISAHKDEIATLDTTHTPEFLSLNPLTGLWPISDFGKNIIIGIIDSGIWPESPSFEDRGMNQTNPEKWNGKCEGGKDFNSSMCNSKIIGVRYFNKGLKEEVGLTMVDSARDTTGHGTQIACIAAGNYVNKVSFAGYAQGTSKGTVAPLAKLAIYKVSWNEGTYLSDIFSAINQAIADGVDVISISLKSNTTVPLFEDLMAIASFSAMKNGIFVSMAAGNEGPSLGTLTNGYPWVLTVASGTIDRWFAGILTFGNGEIITGLSLYLRNSLLKNLPLVYNKNLAACDNPASLSEAPNGIVLCTGGRIIMQMESLLFSNQSGAILVYYDPIRLELIDHFPCACVLINATLLPLVIAYAEHNSKPNVSIKFKETILEVKHAPMVPYYSSRGPSTHFPNILKPDVIAPGTLVLAASIPINLVPNVGSFQQYLKGNYIIVYGSSFACPHVSGVAALLKSVHPKWSISAIKSAIMTTTNTHDNSRKPIRADGHGDDYHYASPLDMGAGHINPEKAFDPGLIYDATIQDYVNFLCSFNYTKAQILNITTSTVYNCLSPSSDLNYPAFISLYNNTRTQITENFRRTVTNVGEGSATYKVKVENPQGCKIIVFPEILVFRRKYDKQSYTLTINHKGNENQAFTFGSLVWLEQNVSLLFKHKVRSPIIVAPSKM